MQRIANSTMSQLDRLISLLVLQHQNLRVIIYKQESLANAKASARQPWYRTQLTKSPLSCIRHSHTIHNLYILEKYFQCETIPSLRMRVYLHYSLVVVASQKCEVAQNSEKIWTYSSLRSTEVIDLGANRKRICDFLFVRHSILHRFWDMANLRIFLPSLIRRPCSLYFLWNFAVNLTVRKLVMGLLCGESCMILTSTVFDWSTRVTDGRAIAYTRHSIYAVARKNVCVIDLLFNAVSNIQQVLFQHVAMISNLATQKNI